MAITFSVLPKAYNFTRNPVRIIGLPGGDAALTRIDIVLTIGTDVITLSETPDLSAYPSGDCPFIFDIAPIIDEYMNNEFTAPAENGTGIAAVSNSPLSIEISCKEYLDGNLTGTFDLTEENNSGNPYLFLQGGVNWRSQFAADDYLIDYYNDNNAPILSWQGANRIADETSAPVLYFFLKEVAPISHHIRVQIWNGTTIVAYADIGAYTPLPNVIYAMYAGYNALGIAAALLGASYTGKITHWTVALAYTDGTPETYNVTALTTFFFDTKMYRKKSRLQFQNSLNGFDDVIFTGDAEIKGEYDRNTASHEINTLSTFAAGMRKNYGTTEQIVKKIYIGNQFSEGQILAMRELLLSPRILEHEDGMLLPIELTEKTKDMIKTEKFTQGMMLEYRYLFTEHSFTPKFKLV